MFIALFDEAKLRNTFEVLNYTEHYRDMIIFGEAYGAKCQGMRLTYGDALKFVVFDIKIDDKWLNVPEAAWIAQLFDLEFVDYAKIPAKLSDIDTEKAKPSVQAVRNGIKEPKEREGIVLRPLKETFDHRGERIITKHKNDSFKETKTKREVDPTRLQILTEANKIADEWVTEQRLNHVLDQITNLSTPDCSGYRPIDIIDTGFIVKLMINDIKREAKGEILESRDAMKAIGSATARMFKIWLANRLKETTNG